MSTVLAIAGTTAVLQDMLANRFVEEPVASAIGAVTVSSGPPDRVDLSGPADPNQVNVFLHQVRPNPGWANVGEPVRDASGARTAAPPLALDLHYLVTAYGAEPLYAEILIAQVAQVFHETPLPPRAVIARALSPTSPPTGFPAALAQSGLEEQFEKLRVTPEALSNEEISKLWSALQARYRPTLAYKVTTALIDSMLPSRQALPVRRPGGAARAAARPRIDAVRPAADRFAPVVAGARIEILGGDLAGPGLALRVGGLDLTAAIVSAAGDRIAFDLPAPLPAGLAAGAQPVVVASSAEIGEPPALREIAVSRPGVLVVTPQASAAAAVSGSVVVDGVTYRDGTLTLTLVPPAARAQRVTALLNAAGGGPSYSFRAPDGLGLPPETATTATVGVPFVRVAAGSYLLRVQVDAGESALATDSAGVFTGPTVAI